MAQDSIFYLDPQPTQGPRNIAAWLATNGDQPPRKAALALSALLCIQAWNPPDPAPLQKAVQIAPLTLKYGDQPPIKGQLTRVERQLKRMAWEPPDPMPLQKRVQIAPLTLTYGDQPAPNRLRRFVAIVESQWETLPPIFQRASQTAAWNVPIVNVVQTPYGRPWLPTILQGWITDPQTAQKQLNIAPLTLTYGQQPPGVKPQAPLARPQWEIDWPSQGIKPTQISSVDNPPGVRPTIPFARAQWDIDWAAQSTPKRQIVSVDNPPPYVQPQQRQAETTWNAQTAQPNAAWNVPVVVVTANVPFSQTWLPITLQSWQPDSTQPRQLTQFQVVDNTSVVTVTALFWNRHRPGPTGR